MQNKYIILFRKHLFPYRFYYDIIPEITDFSLTIKLTAPVNNFDIIDFENLDIFSFLANSFLIDQWINDEIDTDLIQPKIKNFPYDYSFQIEYPMRKIQKDFDKIYLEIRPKKGSNITKENNLLINFEIKPLFILKSQDINYPHLFPYKYFHGSLDTNKTNEVSYILDYGDTYIEVEFSVCSNKTYIITFKDINTKDIINASNSFSLGREIYKLKTTNQEQVLMTIFFSNTTSQNQIDYIVKYSSSASDDFKQFTIMENVISKYDYTSLFLESKWGKIREIITNVKISARYFFFMYEYNNTTMNQYSICPFFEASKYNSTSYNIYKWNKTEIFDLNIGVIGFFIIGKNEYLVSFSGVRVQGGISNINYWIIICAIFLCFFITFTLIFIYRKCRKDKHPQSMKLIIDYRKNNL